MLTSCWRCITNVPLNQKDVSRKLFSSLQIVSIIELLALSMIEACTAFVQISLKNKLTFVKTLHISFDNISQNAKGTNLYIEQMTIMTIRVILNPKPL